MWESAGIRALTVRPHAMPICTCPLIPCDSPDKPTIGQGREVQFICARSSSLEMTGEMNEVHRLLWSGVGKGVLDMEDMGVPLAVCGRDLTDKRSCNNRKAWTG